MWALKRTDGKDVPAYIVGQIIGAALGAFVIWAILETGDNTESTRSSTREALFGGASNGFADHSPSGFAFWAVVITEVVFTALFILVIAGTDAFVGHRRLRGHPDRAHARPRAHDHDPDRQHLGEPGPQLLDRAVRPELGLGAALGVHRVPDHRWRIGALDLAVRHHGRRGLTDREGLNSPSPSVDTPR